MSAHPLSHTGHAGAPEAGHGTLRDYAIGFAVSLVLTLIPFWLVMTQAVETRAAAVGWVLGLGLVQMFFHLVYFLHLKPGLQGGWTLISLVFTFIVIVICLIGSIWVVHNLHVNMIPMFMGGQTLHGAAVPQP
ncbi:MAG: cytochrome o ubiquinol oxidase subunit IV [Comamonas sp.]